MTLEGDEAGAAWDDIGPNKKGGGRRTDGVSLYMKLEPREEPYYIRLTCTPIRFRKHCWAFKSLRQWPISPATDVSEKDLDIAWKDGKFTPALRYAAFVFDREHNRLRILEESANVFGPIASHAQLSKTNAASPTKGWDWIIQVKSVVAADGKKTRAYAVTLDTTKGPTPFTEEEIKTLENPKFQRSELESKYFVKTTPEYLKDLWEQLPEVSRVNSQKNSYSGGAKNTEYQKSPSTKTSAPAAAPKVASSSAPATAQTAAPKKSQAEEKPKVTEPELKLSDDFLSDDAGSAADEEAPTSLF